MNTRTACALLIGLISLTTPLLVFAQSGGATATPSCTITASPKSILQGDTTLLSWSSSTTTTSGTITGIGPVPYSGSLLIAPSQSTQFKGTFTGPLGTAQCSVTVLVSSQPPPSYSGGGVGGG